MERNKHNKDKGILKQNKNRVKNIFFGYVFTSNFYSLLSNNLKLIIVFNIIFCY